MNDRDRANDDESKRDDTTGSLTHRPAPPAKQPGGKRHGFWKSIAEGIVDGVEDFGEFLDNLLDN